MLQSTLQFPIYTDQPSDTCCSVSYSSIPNVHWPTIWNMLSEYPSITSIPMVHWSTIWNNVHQFTMYIDILSQTCYRVPFNHQCFVPVERGHSAIMLLPKFKVSEIIDVSRLNLRSASYCWERIYFHISSYVKQSVIGQKSTNPIGQLPVFIRITSTRPHY